MELARVNEGSESDGMKDGGEENPTLAPTPMLSLSYYNEEDLPTADEAVIPPPNNAGVPSSRLEEGGPSSPVFPAVSIAELVTLPVEAYRRSVDEEQYHSTPIPINPSIALLEAELVTRPVEAYQVVIDEDQIRLAHATFEAVPFDVGERWCNDEEGNQSLWQSIRRRRYSLGFSIALGFMIVGVICAIIIPLVFMRKGQTDEALVDGTQTQSPTYPYPCYTSTVDILRAQMMLDKPLPEAFIVCPNTVIKIGRFKDPSSDDFSFIDGDYPIIPIRENVKILCGIDGRWENNCTLDGGYFQLATIPLFPSPDDGYGQSIDTPVHNFTICGFTFTGRIVDQPPFGGISVILSHPGKNLRFEDCRWTDIFTTTQPLIGIFRNYFLVQFDLPLEGQTIDATFSRCMFNNIIIDFPLFFIWNHSITVERTIFHDISVSAVPQFCRIGSENWNATITESRDICTSLLFCGPGSNCTMNDICIYDFTNETTAMVQVVNGSSTFNHDQLFADNSTSGSCDLNYVTVLGDEIWGSNDCSTILTQETCSMSISGDGTSNPTYPYTCYNSTLDILQAQLAIMDDADVEASTAITEELLFIICPNTTIHVGTAKDPAKNDFTVVDGDYPIVAIWENVTIQCGLDGRQENNCTLDGGFLQVVTMQIIPRPNGEWTLINRTTDNLTIRGITFTGRPLSPAPFGGSSVLLSHPGRGMRFEDCAWTNFSAESGLIAIYRSYYQYLLDLPLDDNSIEVTFSGCTFTNIIYDDPLILPVAQSVTVEKTLFANITMLSVGSYRCGKGELGSLVPENVCSGLVYCGPGSVCTMTDVCVSSFEHSTEMPSIVYVSNTSSFYYSNLFLDTAATEDCQMSMLSQDAITGYTNCTNIFSESVCPITPS